MMCVWMYVCIFMISFAMHDAKNQTKGSKMTPKGKLKRSKRGPKESQIDLGRSLGVLGRSWGDFREVLGRSWAALSAILEVLDHSCGDLGAILAALGNPRRAKRIKKEWKSSPNERKMETNW